MGMGVAKGRIMTEHDQLARRHLTPRSRTIMLEHVGKRLQHQIEILLGEAGSLGRVGGERRRDITVCAVKPIGHDVLAAHCTLVAAFLVVLALGALFFSASFVAAIRVIDTSSGRIGSTERPKANCTGPRTCPALMLVDSTPPKARISKKLSHMNCRMRSASSSDFGVSFRAFFTSGSSGRSRRYASRCFSLRIAPSVT